MGHTVLTPEIPWTFNTNNKKQKFDLHKSINELNGLIDCLDNQIILVGHSLGGVIASMICAHNPEKISRAIYISGFIPKIGQSINDLGQLMTDSIIATNIRVNEKGRILVVPENVIKKGFYHDCDETDYLFAKSLLQPQLASTFLMPVEYNVEVISNVINIYIENLDDRAVPISAQRIMQKNIPINKVEKITSGHSPFFSRPHELARILQAI
jgi:pimeloyl-ACP methyl ester carboxylesterase